VIIHVFITNPGTQSSSPKLNNVRTVRLRLLPNGAQERKLRRISEAAAKHVGAG